MHTTRAIAYVTAALCTSCGEAPDVGHSSHPVIYGQDDRIEWADLVDGPIRTAASGAVATLVTRSRLVRSGGTWRIEGPSLQEAQGLCEGQRFAAQPAASLCTVVLISPDLVLTAGHCVPHGLECDHLAVVFGYALNSDGVVPELPEMSMFGCERIVARATSSPATSVDAAVLKLSRPVTEAYRPATLVVDEPLRLESRYTFVGNPWGLPLKVDENVRILDARADHLDYARVTADSFQGNSGAPLFTEEGRVAAYLTGGEADTAPGDAACTIPKQLQESCSDCSVGGERAAYLREAMTLLCESGDPAACESSLCGGEPACELPRDHSDARGRPTACSAGAPPDRGTIVLAILAFALRAARRRCSRRWTPPA